MAKISFTGFVEDWQKDNPIHPDWALKTSEPHYKKDDEQFVVAGRTYRTVKVAYGVQLDLTPFKSGDKVTITGTEVTEVSERNGQKYYNLTVKADTIELVPSAVASEPNTDWASAVKAVEPLADGAPF